MKDLAFAREKSKILKELPDDKGDMRPAAEECAETPFFRELRTNSMARAVLKLSTDHVEVGERWVDGAGSLCTLLVSGVQLVGSFKLVASIRGVHVGVGVGVGVVVVVEVVGWSRGVVAGRRCDCRDGGQEGGAREGKCAEV